MTKSNTKNDTGNHTGLKILRPDQIKDFLDQYVIGQEEAKITLSVAASDLQDINRMVKNLGTFEIVDLCSVTTAVKEDLQGPGTYTGVPEELAGADHIVRANILVYLKSAGEEAGK